MSFLDARKPPASNRHLLARLIVIVAVLDGLGALFVVQVLHWSTLFVILAGVWTGVGLLISLYRQQRA